VTGASQELPLHFHCSFNRLLDFWNQATFHLFLVAYWFSLRFVRDDVLESKTTAI
jgi:hypothetical protein